MKLNQRDFIIILCSFLSGIHPSQYSPLYPHPGLPALERERLGLPPGPPHGLDPNEQMVSPDFIFMFLNLYSINIGGWLLVHFLTDSVQVESLNCFSVSIHQKLSLIPSSVKSIFFHDLFC